MKKIVLAYSGGLDTSCCIPWLKEKGFEVICFSADLGSEFTPQDLKTRAIKTGAKKIYIKDLRAEFAKEYILPSLKAGACYQEKYLLATALGRPLIAKHLVEVAKKEKAKFISHGCSAKGNDQIRFEVSTAILSPKLEVIAPLREWNLTSRESEIKYARKKNIPIKATKKKIYSIDKNIWGVSIEAGVLEDLVEDRTVGIKSREVYEAPAAWILYTAHKELESLVLDSQTLYSKKIVALKYAQLVYQGLWFSRLKVELDGFINKTQDKVTGKISLKLFKGNIIIAKRSSKYSLYKKELATYGKGDKFDRSLAKGFIDIFSKPYR